MLQMQTPELYEAHSHNENIIDFHTLLQDIRNYNQDLTISDLLDSTIDFNVASSQHIMEQVYLTFAPTKY